MSLHNSKFFGKSESDSEESIDSDDNSDNNSEESIDLEIEDTKLKNIKLKHTKNKIIDDTKKENINIEEINNDDIINNINRFRSPIDIRVNKRNSKKFISTVEGIPKEFFENKEKVTNFMKKIRVTLATSAEIKKENGEYIIIFAGADTQKIKKIIVEYVGCSIDNINDHKI